MATLGEFRKSVEPDARVTVKIFGEKAVGYIHSYVLPGEINPVYDAYPVINVIPGKSSEEVPEPDFVVYIVG